MAVKVLLFLELYNEKKIQTICGSFQPSLHFVVVTLDTFEFMCCFICPNRIDLILPLTHARSINRFKQLFGSHGYV